MNKNSIKDRINTYWSSKSTTFKRSVSLSSIALVVLIGVFVYLYSKDSYEFLLSTTDNAVSANVINKLKEDNIKYDVKGNSIYVAGVNPDSLKLELSGSGVLSPSDSSLELFSSPLFISEKQEDTLIKKDLESNISSAIKSYNEIEDAKVILTMGKESSFKNDNVPAKAAIQVKLKSKLSKNQVNSIQHFVASAVPNLDKSDVVITDTDNNLLSANSDENSVEDNDAYTKGLEDKISSQIQDLLAVAFPNSKFKVVSRVEVNFDKSKIEKETVQSGPDTVVSKETHSEITSNSTASGQAGVESNVPSYETPVDKENNIKEKKSEVINYELNKVKEQIIKSPEIKKLSVAVISNQAIGAVDTAKIQELVETAALIDEERGDKVSVQGFDTESSDTTDNSDSIVSKYMPLIIDKSIPVLILIVILIIALKLISTFREKKNVKEDSAVKTDDIDPVMTEFIPTEEDSTETEALTMAENVKKRDILKKEIDENPAQVASVFKAWQDFERYNKK